MPDQCRYRYRVVDVFTRVPLEGNPLAVFPDSRGIDTGTMQRIAKELNLSETVFFEPPRLADCAVAFRIFTPTREMLFAGHPTVGGSFVALDEGIVMRDSGRFVVEEKIGPIPVRVEQGELPMIWLTTPPITFEKSYRSASCAEALYCVSRHSDSLKLCNVRSHSFLRMVQTCLRRKRCRRSCRSRSRH